MRKWKEHLCFTCWPWIDTQWMTTKWKVTSFFIESVHLEIGRYYNACLSWLRIQKEGITSKWQRQSRNVYLQSKFHVHTWLNRRAERNFWVSLAYNNNSKIREMSWLHDSQHSVQCVSNWGKKHDHHTEHNIINITQYFSPLYIILIVWESLKTWKL